MCMKWKIFLIQIFRYLFYSCKIFFIFIIDILDNLNQNLEDVPSFNQKLFVYNYGKLLKNCILVVKSLLNTTSQNFSSIWAKSTRISLRIMLRRKKQNWWDFLLMFKPNPKIMMPWDILQKRLSFVEWKLSVLLYISKKFKIFNNVIHSDIKYKMMVVLKSFSMLSINKAHT